MKQNSNKSAFYQTIFTVLILLVFSGNIFSHNNTESTFLTSPFNKLVVKGNITVFIIKGQDQKIFFDGNKCDVKLIKKSVNNGVLSLSYENNHNDERVTAFITINNLESVKTIGNVEIETTTNIDLQKLDLNISEETEATFFVNTNLLNLTVSGKGKLNISGEINTLNIIGSGEAKITGIITSDKLDCKTSNFCNVKFTGAVYLSLLSSTDKSSIDLTDCKNIKSSISAYHYSKIKVNSKYVIDISAYDESSVGYTSAKEPVIMENSLNAQINQGTYRDIANN